MPATWFRIALFNLLIAATLGALMRFAFVQEVSWMNFMNIMYTHSHVALMGWGFLALFSLLSDTFLPMHVRCSQKFKTLFWLIQIAVFGMLVTFPFQGYGGYSISASSILLLLSYVFAYYLIKALGKHAHLHPVVRMFTMASIIFYLVSTVALWSMAPIMMMGLKGEAIYYATVQFFLHFQVNGWFIFALVGLVLHLFIQHDINLNTNAWKRVFWLLIWATIFTYALAVAWSNPSTFVFVINSLGAFIQLIAVVLLFLQIRKIRDQIKSKLSNWVYQLLRIAFVCLLLKVLIQTAVILPPVAVVAYTIRNFVIGFLHLILLGMLTHFLLAEGFRRKFIFSDNNVSKSGFYLFFAGFCLTEALLFLQGTLFWGKLGFIPGYHTILFAVTMLLPVGIFFMWSARYFPRMR